MITEALAHADAGRLDQAAAMLKRLVQREPGNPDAAHFLGMVLSRTPALTQAEYFLRRAVELAPGEPKYLSNLANVLAACERHAEAVECYRGAIEARPGYAPAWIGLSGALLPLGRPDEAVLAAREAVRTGPDQVEPHLNLAIALMSGGRPDAALDGLRDTVQRVPSPDLLSMIAFLGNYIPGMSREQSLADHRAAGRAIAPDPLMWRPPALRNSREPDRRLRVAYLSADFRTHSVAWFAEALVTHHDRRAVEVICATPAPVGGPTAQRFKAKADAWLDLHALPDDALAARLRQERIDIVVELSGLSAGNRLGAVAHGPAPVTCSYIGYPSTTGVPGVGHRIVDGDTDPPDADAFATERLVRLDRCFLCYTPSGGAPEPVREPSPAGVVTFGSFNALAKINEPVIDAWAGVLRGVPGSRLIIKPVPAEPSLRARYESAFASRGVDPSRLELVGYLPGQSDHMALYGRVDVALDTFPYNGTTTTCEALWMGVPVVALAGSAHAGRVGVSLLNAAGLTDLVAGAPADYVWLATGLAADRSRLAGLRGTLRGRLRASPLCDGPGHCRALERVYRDVWREWCAARA